jgi:hypothetical protein
MASSLMDSTSAPLRPNAAGAKVFTLSRWRFHVLRCEAYSPSRRSRAADLSRLTTIGFLQEAELILGREPAPAGFLRYFRIARLGCRGARAREGGSSHPPGTLHLFPWRHTINPSHLLYHR